MPKRGQRTRQRQIPRTFKDQFLEGLRMLGKMLACSKAFKVADLVVERIPIDVVNVMPRGDRPMSALPDVAVQ